MKTVILSPYELNSEGVVYYYCRDGFLEVRYSINFREENRVATLWGLSSKKPSGYPLKIVIPLVENGRAEGSVQLAQKDLAIGGYNLKDIDTFALVCKSPIGMCVASLGFGGLNWNISYSIDRLCREKEQRVLDECSTLLENPVSPNTDQDAYRFVITELKASERRLCKASVSPLGGYNWYIYPFDVFPFNMSIYRHLTSAPEFEKAYQNNRICFLGIGNVCHTALAIKSERNPFVNAEDASVYINGHWIVGVGLLPEGQCFEKPDTKKGV